MAMNRVGIVVGVLAVFDHSTGSRSRCRGCWCVVDVSWLLVCRCCWCVVVGGVSLLWMVCRGCWCVVVIGVSPKYWDPSTGPMGPLWTLILKRVLFSGNALYQ